VTLAAGVALAAGYFAWFRDSSIVAVTDVKVEGVSSADRDRIVGALTQAGKSMTTLHVRSDELAHAAASFPTVASVSASANFPHGLVIRVVERQPALVATSDDRQTAVAADGSLLPGLPVDDRLPEIAVDSVPEAGRLGGDALAEALAVGPAPAPLRPLITTVSLSDDYGVVATMRGGIELRLGTGRDAAAKWAAAAAILADPKLESASYVDVRVPQRPAVGP
jgi:cell division protein FtsQ